MATARPYLWLSKSQSLPRGKNVLYSLSLAQLRAEIERHVKGPVWK